MRRDRLNRGLLMSSSAETIHVSRASGAIVEGEAIVSEEGFSPRYDSDRWRGVIRKPGHKFECMNIHSKILFFPTARGYRSGLGHLLHQGESHRTESLHYSA